MACTFNGVVGDAGLNKQLQDFLNGSITDALKVYKIATSQKFREWFNAKDDSFNITGEAIDENNLSTLVSYTNEYFNEVNMTIGKDRIGQSNANALFDDTETERHVLAVLSNMYLRAEDYLVGRREQNSLENIKEVIRDTIRDHLYTNYDNLSEAQLTVGDRILDMTDADDGALINRVIRQPNVLALSKSLKVLENTVTTDDVIEDEESAEEDGYFKSWEDGDKRNFVDTVSKTVKRIFETQRQVSGRVVADGTIIYDSDTPTGLPEAINFVEYYRSIKNNGVFDNVETFLDSLEHIADTIPNRLALLEIVKKARTNPNIANVLYVNFSQPALIRNEFRFNNGSERTIASSNQNMQPMLVVRNEMLSALSNNFGIDVTVPLKYIRSAKNVLRSKKKIAGTLIDGTSVDTVEAYVYNAMKFMGLDIPVSAIENYAKRSFNNNPMELLIDTVTHFIEAYNEVQLNARHNKQRMDQAKKDLSAMRAADNGEMTIPGHYSELVKAEELKPIMTTELQRRVMEVAVMMSPFMDVHTEFNSRSVDGELVSDIIKNSYLTKMFQIIKNEAALQAYIKSRPERQYMYSNILRTQRIVGTNGRPITIPGLVNGTKSGELATDAMQLELFNGTANNTLGETARYADMTPSDFDITMVMEYLNPDPITSSKMIDVGKYFTTVPSDSSKTFLITSYKLAIKDLMKSEDVMADGTPVSKRGVIPVSKVYGGATKRDDVTATNIIDAIKSGERTAYTHFNSEGKTTSYYELKEGDIVKFADGNNYAYARITKRMHKLNANDDAAEWSKKEGFTEEFYKDEVVPEMGRGAQQMEFEYVPTVLNRSVNHNHPIHLALRNIVMQEIENMKQAFESIFDLDANGQLQYDSANENELGAKAIPRLRKDTKLYRDYHTKKGSPLDSNGNLVGNVFQFWNAVVDMNSNDGNLNPNVWLSDKSATGMFSFLYGGSKTATDEEVAQYVDSYINNKTDAAVEYYEKYKANIDGYSEALIREMVLNYTIQYNNFADLFDGDPKFYKDPVTTVKRNKQTQGSGLVYGAYNIDPTKQDDVVAELSLPSGKRLTVNRTFKYGTFNNTSKSSNNIEGIRKALNDAHVPSDRIGRLLQPFRDKTNVDDAQSYTTLDEFAKRMYLAGEWDTYKDIFDKLFAEQPLTGDEIDKFIQVQKNFYYDMPVDENMNLAVPNQIKNAEFILIPQYIRGTSLEAIHDAMVKNGVGQLNVLETTKAAANDWFDLFDSNGNIAAGTMDRFDTYLRDSAKTGEYSSLYRQQDTPQHMDGVNKASIQVVKKMLDNLPGKWGQEKRQRYFNLMGANIQASFEELAAEIGLELVDNKYMLTDADGNYVANINNSKLYDLIADELIRTGSNSNIMEYATLDSTGKPNMPSWMPAVRKKMQSVFQSMFTNNVTKQKLPGFHAVQVSGVGFHEYEHKYGQEAFEAKYGKLDRTLQYHKDGVPYIEVMLPMWMKSWHGRDITIADLEAAGLTDMIGYRIPTEGKQSTTRMKVVGLLHESYGSTIVVPDEWVTQTGADFDVDTIYGIYYDSYLDKNHKPKKIAYLDDNSDAFERYAAYVSDKVSRRLIRENRPGVSSAVINEAKRNYKEAVRQSTNELRDYYQDEIDKAITEENTIYKDSSNDVQNIMKQTYNDNFSVDANGDPIRPKFAEMVKKYLEALKAISESADTAIAADARLLYNQYEKIDSIIAQQKALEAHTMDMYFENYNDFKDDYFQSLHRQAIINAAEVSGLPSFAEFQTMSIERQNSRAARNNAILDNMMDIISDPRAAEELLSRSNFDDIINAREVVYEALGVNKEWTDIRSPIGQAKYRDQTMSGYTLKAISVKRDTFNSVSNIAKTALPNKEKGITVRYKKSDVSNIEDLNKRFPDTVTDDGDFVQVEHRNVGWSEDNLNVLGKTLTVYSSETTAWILDNVKAGGIRNVGLETFDVFKTFIDMGIDYETAIAFMNQPAITAVVQQNNATNSIFSKYHSNPVRAAEHQLLYEHFGGRNRVDVNKYLTKLGLMKKNKRGGEVRTVPKLVLNKGELIEHLRPDSNISAEDRIKYQMSVLETYSDIKQIADGIGSYGAITNLDKIGAGQSLTQVHNTVERIDDLRQGKGRGIELVSMAKFNSTEKGNEVPAELAEAIYPVGDFNTLNPEDSVYPTLAYHYKYSMLASDIIVGQLFATENEGFRRLKKRFPTNDEQSIFNLENYVISDAMSNTPFVLSNDIATNGTVVDVGEDDEYAAKQRVYGFGREIVLDFDFNDRSDANIADWLRLSPGNKLLLLKNKVKGNSVLDFLVPTLSNTRNKAKEQPSPHIIKVYDNSTDEENLFELFRDLYYKDNVWYKTMANDLVRYAALVEGMQYRFNNVSKIIPAEILYNSESENGTGLVQETGENISLLSFDSFDVDKIIDKFFRTYSYDKYIPKFENKSSKQAPAGRIQFDVFGTDVAIIDRRTAEYAGVIEHGTGRVKPYIWTNRFNSENKRPTLKLYKTFVKNVIPANNEGHFSDNKVDKNGMATEIILYPVNKLERNETNDRSVNDANNIYVDIDAMANLLDFAYSGRSGNGQVISNSVASLYRAMYGIGRNYINLTAETRAVQQSDDKRTIIREAMHVISNGEVAHDGTIVAYEDGFSKDDRDIISVVRNGNIAKQLETLRNNPDGFEHYTRIIVEDGDTAKDFIKAFEDVNYTRYSIIGGGRNRNVISQRLVSAHNQEDKLRISRERIDKMATNRVYIDTESGAYQQILNRFNTSTLDNDILNNKPTFIAISPMMANSIGLLEGTRTIIAYKGKKLVVTNIGLVNSRTAAVAPTYKLNKKTIDKVVKDGLKLYSINDISLIEANEYNNAVSTYAEEEEFDSSIGELDDALEKFIDNSIAGINDTIKFENDETARRTREELATLKLTVNNSEVYDDKVRLAALSTMAFYNEKRSAFLLNKVNHFVRTNPANATTGVGPVVDMAINDPALFDMMLDNNDLQNEFMHIVNSVTDFIADAKSIADLELYDTNKSVSDEETIFMIRANDYIEKLKHQATNINELENRTRRATDMFYEKVIANASTDPMIQQGLRNILEPYRDESTFFSKAADAQESGVPIVQLVLSKIVNSMRKSELEAKREANNLTTKYKAIKAQYPGVTWGDLIDPDTGYFILPYNQDMIDVMRQRKQELTVTAKRHGTRSSEYRTAYQANEEWLTNHTIRPYVASYYDDRAAAYHILDDYAPLRNIIADIRADRATILANVLDNDYTTLSTDDIKKLNDLDDLMDDIKKGTHPWINEDSEIMSHVDAYFAKLGDIEKTYKTRELREGFESLLEHNLTIIKTSEAVMSKDQLENSDTYNNAQRWMKANTFVRTSEEIQEKLKKAFGLLKSVDPNAIDFRTFVKGRRDGDGVVNGNLFTEDEVKQLKTRSNKANDASKNDYNEKLIRNRDKNGSDKIVYQATFYNALKGDARSADETAARNEVIRDINAITLKYVQTNGRIQTANMTIEELNRLAVLYEKLRDLEFQTYDTDITITKPDGTTIVKKGKQRNATRANFLAKNVKFITDRAEFAYQRHIAKSKGREYYNAWTAANMQEDMFDENGGTVPNTYLYSQMKVDTKWIDATKTKAKAFIEKTVEFTPTNYYWQRVREEMNKGDESFEAWREANHIWDTDSNNWVPLRIWQKMEVIDKSIDTIEAKSKWYNNHVKDEYKDPKYEQGAITPRGATNESAKFRQIQGDAGKKALYDLWKDTIDRVVEDPNAKSLLNKGYVPYSVLKHVDKGFKNKLNELIRGIGWYDAFDETDIEMEYGRKRRKMPMLSRYTEERTKRVEPQDETQTDDEYADYLEQIYAENEATREKNIKAHVLHSNTNYDELLPAFVDQAVRFANDKNNEDLIRMTSAKLRGMKYLNFKSDGTAAINKRLGRVTGKNTGVRTESDRAAKHFEHVGQRIMLGGSPKENSTGAKIARILKNVASLRFMAINLTGGVANIGLGEANIAMEAVAGTFFSVADMHRAKGEYTKQVINMLANMNKDTSTTVTDGIIKLFNVVDLDNITEISVNNSTDKIYKKVVRYLYAQQAGGEHEMQNTALLAALRSHKLVDINGKYQIMNLDMYRRNVREKALRKVMKDYDRSAGTKVEEAYDKFIKDLHKPKNIDKLIAYNDYKRDVITDFISSMPNEAKTLFADAVKDETVHTKAEFEGFEDMHSQFELKDGHAVVKAGSHLTDAHIAQIRNKVIIINHKIHGIYDAMGASVWQDTWWGQLAYQFKKHIIPQWHKHLGYGFNYRGRYNESREAVDKGMYNSFIQFLTTPFRSKMFYNATTEELETLEAMHNVGKNFIDFARHARTYYNILPDYEKANINRTLTEFAAGAVVFLVYLAGKMWEDPHEKDTQAADYVIYLADKLASEIFAYTPTGIGNEAKKIFKSPFASYTLVDDVLGALGAVTDYAVTGNSYNLRYASGPNAGQNKLWLYGKKQIPVYGQYLKHKRLGYNNSYYKLGNNVLGVLPVSDWIDKAKRND